jgi:hypothetical protein
MYDMKAVVPLCKVDDTKTRKRDGIKSRHTVKEIVYIIRCIMYKISLCDTERIWALP